MKGILFDMDGTLLDSMEVWIHLANRYLDSMGLDKPENLQEEIKTMTLKEALAHFKTIYRLDDSVEEMLVATHRILADAYKNTVVKKPQVDAVLQRLKSRGHRMAVSTATTDELSRPALSHHKLSGYFDFCRPYTIRVSAKTTRLTGWRAPNGCRCRQRTSSYLKMRCMPLKAPRQPVCGSSRSKTRP